MDHDRAVRGLLEAERSLAGAAVMVQQAVAAVHRLSVLESQAIETLRRMGPLTHSELADELGLSAATNSELVDRLVRKQVARREPWPQDARFKLVTIDADYASRVEAVSTRVSTELRALCRGYTAENLRQIARFVADTARLRRDVVGEVEGLFRHSRDPGS